MFAVTGMYGRQHEETGVLGLVGYAVVVIGNVLFASLLFVSAYIIPGIERTWVLGAVAIASPVAIAAIPASLATLIVGLLLFAVANTRSGALPRAGAWPMFAGMLLNLVSNAAGLPVIIVASAPVLFGLGLAWIGVAMWSDRRQMTSQPAASAQK